MESKREWSVIELARLAGATRRALRHYAEIGLLTPSRVSRKGYRYYGEAELLRLQRILLLRELGLGLQEIQRVLDRSSDDATTTLRAHLEWLRCEATRLGRQIRAVEHTLELLEEGAPLVADKILDGFDHTRYREEVVRRWGADAYQRSNAWWQALSDAERTEFMEVARRLAVDWGEARRMNCAAEAERAQALAERHVAWLQSIPGTPAHGVAPTDPSLLGYVAQLATMYVDDPRFAQHYDRHGEGTALLVRDALRAWCGNSE